LPREKRVGLEVGREKKPMCEKKKNSRRRVKKTGSRKGGPQFRVMKEKKGKVYTKGRSGNHSATRPKATAKGKPIKGKVSEGQGRSRDCE